MIWKLSIAAHIKKLHNKHMHVKYRYRSDLLDTGMITIEVGKTVENDIDYECKWRCFYHELTVIYRGTGTLCFSLAKPQPIDVARS